MKPRDLLKSIAEESKGLEGIELELAKAKYLGAYEMYSLTNGKFCQYREKNREKLRKYNTEYVRAYRAKKKAEKKAND